MNILDFGPYGLFVWGSLGMCAIAVVLEVAGLRARSRALREAASDPLRAAGGQAADAPRAPVRLTQERGQP